MSVATTFFLSSTRISLSLFYLSVAGNSEKCLDRRRSSRLFRQSGLAEEQGQRNRRGHKSEGAYDEREEQESRSEQLAPDERPDGRTYPPGGEGNAGRSRPLCFRDDPHRVGEEHRPGHGLQHAAR